MNWCVANGTYQNAGAHVMKNQLTNFRATRPDIPKCVILAAGASTRLRPLTDTMPKCLLKVGGKTLLERTVEHILASGIKEIALVIGFQAENIREFVKQRFPQQGIRFILESKLRIVNEQRIFALTRTTVSRR